ncbi:hypothetical protein CKO51_25360 [Rhodopirellula sp. SM50]|nr:hypothetical protein CKO51_25360 [Rhodopirellula sp. SM50]
MIRFSTVNDLLKHSPSAHPNADRSVFRRNEKGGRTHRSDDRCCLAFQSPDKSFSQRGDSCE